jgi:hypothetical protein
MVLKTIIYLLGKSTGQDEGLDTKHLVERFRAYKKVPSPYELLASRGSESWVSVAKIRWRSFWL